MGFRQICDIVRYWFRTLLEYRNGIDFRQYYNLEYYLLNKVRHSFRRQGRLSAEEFFCIVIWKANRRKSTIANRLLAKGYDNLNAAVEKLTTDLKLRSNAKDRLRFLWEEWEFRLPMASAILTILYPDEFTVYDKRVCDVLKDFHYLNDVSDFDDLWDGYQKFKRKVEESSPPKFSLRDKDRFLWGKSFYEQLKDDIKRWEEEYDSAL